MFYIIISLHLFYSIFKKLKTHTMQTSETNRKTNYSRIESKHRKSQTNTHILKQTPQIGKTSKHYKTTKQKSDYK